MKFKVLRDHIGDKDYFENDVREAELFDVRHLIPLVLQPLDDKSEKPTKVKAERALKNKAE